MDTTVSYLTSYHLYGVIEQQSAEYHLLLARADLLRSPVSKESKVKPTAFMPDGVKGEEDRAGSIR